MINKTEMLSRNDMELLSSFFPLLENMTLKELEVKSGLSHESVFRLTTNLEKKGFFKKENIGKTNLYRFVKNDFTYQIFVYYMTKKRLLFKSRHNLLYKRLYEFLNEINPEGPAIIFGSYAKGTEVIRSDIDLLCVTKGKNVRKISKTYRTKYDINIQPVVLAPSDFKNIKRDNKIFWSDLIKFGIVLDGLDLFFKEVYANEH